MGKKYKPTFEEYKKMGQMFKETRRSIVDLHIYTSQKIGKTKVDKLCNFWTFDKKFQHLKSQIEEMMFRDYPEESNTDIFYGENIYLRPLCPLCMSDELSWVLAAGNGLICLKCKKTFYLTEGETRKRMKRETDKLFDF